MNKSFSSWQIAGFLFTSIAGTFLHFLYDLTGQNVIAGLFSAVNESIWEHMKLLFFPMFVFSLIAYRQWGEKQESFWCVQLAGILLGLALIPVLYYTYTGILGVSADWFNVTIFFIAAAAAYWLETKLLERKFTCWISSRAAFALICVIGLIFVVLTFFPPRIPFFQDPITGSYGRQAPSP